ncbi:4-alpha-glucanotransferase [Nanchangia anserum]|uniref:4-alpha-glucanotransferase n=2 Tax=Nanchangia anserum TaxID=2692125 RepID=A0A8I0GBC1_9ACTO|nr:4-alpha-glucanotransferase [Nanchangia anserum]MBD3688886.1 4-alpha-glucanotransferase [Nanchangia anserum]QOX82612.1 4-alpha-glucanotransferase [Nanchangia anserum]
MCGVATEYWDFSGHHQRVSEETLRAVLAALDVDTSSDDAIAAAHARRDEEPWRHILPPCTVNQDDHNTWVPVHVPHGAAVRCHLELEDGGRVELNQVDHWVEPRVIDGVLTGRATFDIPAGLPLGWHTIVAEIEGQSRAQAPFANTPARLELPRLRDERGWGIMAQLYSVRSAGSWGIGDAHDLADIARWAAGRGADFVLINPVHAGEAVPPVTPSPYLPASRLFASPLYIRPEDIDEYARLDAGTRTRIERWRQRACEGQDELLDRDRAWQLKLAALDTIFAVGRSEERAQDFAAWRKAQGEDLERFAAWCALNERWGLPLPEHLRDVDSEEVAVECRKLSGRCDFYAWLQWIVAEQFAAAQEAATAAGMRIGIMHDLAVGVHKRGADTWARPEAFAQGIAVGAPADMYNQLGQNWSQPPWRPDTLEAQGYAPLRDMVRRLARMGGALRLDHIMGLFRLWWIPQDADTPADGTYLRYRFDHMVGVMALEAARAGCVVVGEDLGTVEPWVRDYLAERGVLGTAVAWFEYEDGKPRPPAHYRRLQLAAVNTHDLPPLAGYLRDEHVRIRADLGILEFGEDEEYARAKAERDAMAEALREAGVLGEDDSVEAMTDALYRFVAAAPSALVSLSLTDATGERRAQNQPGTDREYPNWSIPLGDGDGTAVMVEDLASGAFDHLLDVVESAVHA